MGYVDDPSIYAYILRMRGVAKVFWSGNSQAVRLPRECRFPEGVESLLVRRDGNRIVLEPPARRKFTRRFWKALGALPEFKRPKQVRQRRKVIWP
jgi:virulence-associated protein VagC